MQRKRIAIFASGSGTNAERFIKYFEPHPEIEVAWIISNKPQAKVLERASNHSVSSRVFRNEEMAEKGKLLSFLQTESIDFIVLAGFLQKIQPDLINHYQNRIINIHPSLLPKFGGKGMYGMRVHQAVIDAKEKESGISIHLVNEEYDKGKLLKQVSCKIGKDMQAEDLAAAIHSLEHTYFPKVVEDYIKNYEG